jgi:DNA-binding transcriptional LysR family regulator
MEDWDDLRYFLAVARVGSLTGAARPLKVDATTVGRRISQLERSLGATLFVRRRDRWTLTPTGEHTLPLAERAEAVALEVSRAAAADTSPVGRVRLTTIDEVASRVIVPLLPELHDALPGIRLDLLCTSKRLDLSRGEADLAVRIGRPSEPDLLARRVAVVRELPHASIHWLRKHNLEAQDVRHLDGRDVVLLMTGVRERWTEGLGDVRVRLRSTSPEVTYAAIAAGLGVGLVAELLAHDDPRLVPLPGLLASRESGLWMIGMASALAVPRVRAVADHLGAQIAARYGD